MDIKISLVSPLNILGIWICPIPPPPLRSVPVVHWDVWGKWNCRQACV